MSDKKTSEIDIEIGLIIRHERKRRGMSQEDLAHAIGISYQQIQKYEKASNRVAAAMLALIAEVFALPVQELYPLQFKATGRKKVIHAKA